MPKQCVNRHFSSGYPICFRRLLYNAGRCFVQFVMPLSIVVGVYISIFWRLLHRPVSQHSENHRRRRRTNIMIISVSVTFFLSWLPLNTLNFMLDLKNEEIEVIFQFSLGYQRIRAHKRRFEKEPKKRIQDICLLDILPYRPSTTEIDRNRSKFHKLDL